MSIQNNFPAIKPSLNLDFANTKQLDPRITFARASTARFYDGKTTALAEQNWLNYSQTFDNGYWFKALGSVSANSATAPDGTTTAETLTANIGTGLNEVSAITLGSVFTNNSPITFSCFIKANTKDSATLSYSISGSDYAVAVFDLTLGTVSQSASAGTCTLNSSNISNAGSGWYRCSITFTCTNYAANTNVAFLGIAPAKTGNIFGANGRITGTYLGVESVYLWGAQLEQRSFATAYTPTTTAPVTNYIPVLQTATAGTPRFDHNPVTGESLGLLIEEQRTNLLPYSETFDSPAWVKSGATIVANNVISPDGTSDAAKMILTSGLTGYFGQSVSVSAGTYSFTIYLKAGEYRRVALWEGNVSAYYVVFDLVAGTIISAVGGGTTTGSIQSVGNGWYRCSMISTQTDGTRLWLISPVGNSATSPFVPQITGNGFSGVYLWGAQLESGAFATSYIPTALTYSGRASTGTFRAPNGLIQTAAINAPRYEVNAGGGSNLLLEGAASNLLKYTEQFDNNIWGKNRVIAVSNQVVAPDGSSTADILTATTGTSDSIYQAVSVSNAVHTISFWIKGVGNTNSAAFGVITSGFIASTATVLSGPGTASGTTFLTITGLSEKEWTRVSFTTNAAFGAGICGFYIHPGGGNTANASVALWGAQLETGSAATSYIPSVETFTGRASTATYYDSTGIIRTAASGQARYSYNPQLLFVAPKLLLEAQGTNLLLQSNDLTSYTITPATGLTSTANAAVAPDGTNTARRLTNTTTTEFHRLFQSVTLITSTAYTHTVYLKNDTAGWAQLCFFTGIATTAFANFNLVTGVLGTVGNGTATITPVGNNWYRCSVTATAQGVGGNLQLYVIEADSNLANPTTTGTTKSVFVWGAQLETGTAATSYIPTLASQVTRVADTSTSAAQSRAADVYSSAAVTRATDVASITGTNFSSWYNQQNGSLYTEWVEMINTVALSGNSGGVSLNANSTTPCFEIYVGADYIRGSARGVGGGGVSSINISQSAFRSAGTSYKVAMSFSQSPLGNVADMSINGTAYPFNTTLTSNSMQGINQLDIGKQVTSGVVTGTRYFKKITYYPIRLTNTQIQSLTT